MTYQEQFEKETGQKAIYIDQETMQDMYSNDYAVWLETKLQEAQAKNKDLEGRIETFKKEGMKLISCETSLGDLARSLRSLCKD